jgi:XisI protein
MDKVTHYRTVIQALLDEYAQYRPSYGQVEVEKVSDTVNDHYQLVTVGWNGYERIHGIVFHLDIKDGKIWVQHDGTEEGVAHRLVEQGVPKADIVLAFHTPFRRQFTGFAVE